MNQTSVKRKHVPLKITHVACLVSLSFPMKIRASPKIKTNCYQKNKARDCLSFMMYRLSFLLIIIMTIS